MTDRDATGSTGATALRVTAQNAGVLAYRHDDSIIWEMFELSARNEAVISTKGRLNRTFPGAALATPTVKLVPALTRTLARTLERMSNQVVPDAIPITFKGGRSHEEIRDTAHPKMVTQLMAAFLLPLGSARDVSSIRKHTRDEVLWDDCKTPWRRSSLWLLIRVSIHLIFLRSGLDPADALSLYKHFLILFAVHVISKAAPLLRDDKACTEWCDLVFTMKAKVARRLHKLEEPLPEPIQRAVHDVMADDILGQTWDTIRESEAEKSRINMAPLHSLVFEEDTAARLPRLDEFIDQISKRQRETLSLQFTPRCPLPEFDDMTRWKGPGASKSSILAAAWCDNLLPESIRSITEIREQGLDADDRCADIWYAMVSYEEMIRESCAGNPEAWSLMVLGVLELWVTCDMHAVAACAVLHDYDPGIDARRLQSLLLPHRRQMERLRRVERYIAKRQEMGKNKGIWTSFGEEDTFAVRYFDASEGHQSLRRRVEEEATKKREDKVEEFNSRKAKHTELIHQFLTMTCSNVSEMRNGQIYECHDEPSCHRCQIKNYTRSMEISIHEWPLPTDERALKTVLFELEVPGWFTIWRQATRFVGLELLKCSYLVRDTPGSHERFALDCDPHLKGYFASRLPSRNLARAQLLSRTKPNIRTHYKAKKISSLGTAEELLFENALHYEYFDSYEECFVTQLSPDEGVEEMTRLMTYQLPPKSGAIQQFIHRPPALHDGLPPNSVLATQSQCPDHLSLAEYKALCTIPLGHRLQWQNILVQLASPTVDFKKVETCMTILLCMYQAGLPPKTSQARPGHGIPTTREEFGETMLESLRDATARIEGNWRSVDELGCYVAIARRLLSLTSADALKRESLAYLSWAREISLGWVRALKGRVDSAADGDRSRLRSKVAHAALVCVDTFNLQDTLDSGDDALELALRSPGAAADFMECCITIQECYSADTDGLEPIIYWRWQHLCVRAYSMLHHAVVVESSDALNIAIQRSWVAFTPTETGWTTCPTSGCQHGGAAWLTTESGSSRDGQNLRVHYCLVTGELRVNGYPLNRLPREYEGHPVYARLFGSAVLEVMPGHIPGMPFSGKKLYAEHEVHFGLSEDHEKDLLVRSVRDNQSWEFVHPRLLYGFPRRLIDEYVHWYDLSSNTVKFRARKDPWTTSVGNWKLAAGVDGKWHLAKGDDRVLIAPTLLNEKSHTAKCMDAIFSSLVDATDLELIHRPSLSMLEIELPRLKLAFQLQEGEALIKSRHFRGMIVDPDQAIGSLIGLKNKLVLKGKSKDVLRKVVLLEGPVTYTSTQLHTRVSISRDRAVLAHVFDVDTRLERLIDNGSLESKLLICYLHALTTFCLPDPLTKLTGTERALKILDFAAVRSFSMLRQKNIDLLKTIARLTPSRNYYPEHLKVMQSVSWSAKLGFLAQQNGFLRAVTSLTQSAAARGFLYREEYIEMPKLDFAKQELVKRDEIRSATLRVAQYGAENHTTSWDREYSSRDLGQDSYEAHHAFSMAEYVVNNRDQLPHKMPSDTTQHMWDYLVAASGSQVLGSQHRLSLGGDEDTPEYDVRWLLDTHAKVLGRNFVLYHNALSRRTQAIYKYDVAMWLSTLAFAKSADLVAIQLLASMFNRREMESVNPPGAKDFAPERGYSFDRSTARGDLENNRVYRQFTLCPEYHACKGKGSEAEYRSKEMYRSSRRKALDAFLGHAKDKWPCSRPALGHHEKSGEWQTYINTSEAVAILHKQTTVWYDNYELEKYLRRIVDLLPESRNISTHGLRAVRRSATESLPGITHRPGFIRRTDLFLCPPPELGQLVPAKPDLAIPHSAVVRSPPASSFDDLLCQLNSTAGTAYEKKYVAGFRKSVESLAARKSKRAILDDGVRDIVEAYLAACRYRMDSIYSVIIDVLNHHMAAMCTAMMSLGGAGAVMPEMMFSAHWPRLSASFLLEQISQEPRKHLPDGWKNCIVEYGVSIVELQRAERMSSAALCGDITALSNEILNAGHTNWDALEFLDSLLLEVESGITIRDVQEDIASRMRDPPESRNAVMQLNMGEGKSSVIVPIVASALADGKRLVRVFVAKPQSKQMFQMLTSKLGGLLNRVIFQLPFSRSLQVNNDEALSIRRMLEACRDVGGVLLVQPEHALSLQQMGTEYAISPEKTETAKTLNLIRDFLFHNARDIVDESDENFSVKFELVYTMGLQQPVDDSPQRWQTTQKVLDCLREISIEVRKDFPDAIEIQDNSPPGSFPRTRVLKEEALQSILDKLVSRIFETCISGFHITQQTPAVRDAVRVYLTKKGISEEEISRVERPGREGFWSDTVRSTLLLLRGLVADNILGFTFTQKRWRVNYGLAPDRRSATRLAVPYRAKDQPSPRSEFSHPEVIIILTCLAYYYEGLTDNDLFIAIDHLLRSDRADIEYSHWVHGNTDVLDKFKTLAGVNPEDRDQCVNDIFPPLKFSKAVIDYFLKHIVFPKEMKEFPSKLSSSGWDLAIEKAHPTTGFSGTNDSRALLPLGMQQRDLEELNHTNALVMSYLLQPETSVTDIPPKSPTQTSDADALLDLVTNLDTPVRVILDVGAQVLELGNFDVARQWLRKTTDNHIKAVVFFDDDDELSVVDRTGHTEPLQTSPWASQLDTCLVFLDEAHTRGTDLKLPTGYRAAVTLGANQTKDELVQGMVA